ncbi:ATP-binding cassette domain-containing protein [Mycoplasmatota bacterium]|nr:ATP-binding cassette domain-containing protein [Mycoplasmatota bacterium]
MINCKNVSFEYEKNKKILKNINFNLPTGHIGVLLGLNGCGKTTLLKCIGKNLTHYNGAIKVEDNCRYIKELPTFCEELTGIEYVEMLLSLGGNHTNDLVYKLIDSIGVKKNLELLIKNTSLYTRNVLVLLSSLCLDSDIILLDNPFSGLDRKSQLLVIKLIKILKEERKTVLIATNLTYFGFDIADELFILNRGKIRHIKNIFHSSIQYENQIMPLLLK